MKKTIKLALAAALPMLAFGCTQTSTVQDNSVAAQLARSTPPGSVLTNNPVNANAVAQAQNASNNPNVASILNALSAAQLATTPNTATTGVPATLTPSAFINAMNNAQIQAVARARQPKVGPGQGIVGPGPLFQPVTSSQVQNQYVPALSTPY